MVGQADNTTSKKRSILKRKVTPQEKEEDIPSSSNEAKEQEEGVNPFYEPIEEEGGEDEEVRVFLESKKKKILKPSVNNINALNTKLAEISDSNIPWPDTLVITASKDLECGDIHDDLSRESSFYRQALECAEVGLELCDQFGLKHIRPNDYYAEMLKSDQHMYKVRQQLALTKKKIEVKEQRRAQRDALKYGQLIEKQKRKEKEEHKKKKKRMEQQLRNQLQKRDSKYDLTLDENAEDAGGDEDTKPDKRAPQGKSKKRKLKEIKFGGGRGRARGSKHNTRESYLGMETLPKVSSRQIGKSKKLGRPGKSKRQQSKSKSRR